MENMSLSDIAAVTGNDYGNGNCLWMIVLFALLFGGLGGYGGYGRGGEQLATSADVQRGFDTNSIEQQVRGVTYGLADLGYAIDNKVEGTKDFLAAAIGGTKDAVVGEGRSLQMQVAEAHCADQRNIDALRYDLATHSAAIQANDTANTQKVLDQLCRNKEEAMQARINQLELQQAMCGVVRYPTQSAWAFNGNPFCGNGCGCGNF